jgi:cation diffusion facilitator CzcD-associated flavoprotein CzcO
METTVLPNSDLQSAPRHPPVARRRARAPVFGTSHHRVVIVGAGFAGVGMAIRLLGEGERDFVVLEKASDVGGTWRDNTYPGCQCDVPSNLYSFSFAPNPNWSRDFAWQSEILEYIKGCVDRYGVRPHLRFDTELVRATWDDALQRWRIETNRGTFTADVLVSGHGGLSAPSVPDLPGLGKFKGKVFHSASFRHDEVLEGKRVGVIGTGASAIQIVPSIQPRVAELALFQRTPPWIVPRFDQPFSARKLWLFRTFPILQKLDRLRIYLLRELLVLAMVFRPRWLKWIEFVARKHLETQVADPSLRRKLLPSYSIGCKRMLLSNDYYPALCQPNARVVTDAIREVNERGIVTSDGTFHEVDVIVLCTGFKVTDHPIVHRFRGREGRTLAEHWAAGASSYLGASVAGFPNLFLMTGPYTAVGHTSIVYMLESQFEYVLDALRQMKEHAVGAFDVREDALATFVDEMDHKQAKSVWNSGCRSWYLDANGRNTTVWPSFSFRFRSRTRRFDRSMYRADPRMTPQQLLLRSSSINA